MLEDQLKKYVELACPALSRAEKAAFALDLFNMAVGWADRSEQEREVFLSEASTAIARRFGKSRSENSTDYSKTFEIVLYYSKKSVRSTAELTEDAHKVIRSLAKHIARSSAMHSSQELPLFEIGQIDERAGEFKIISTRIHRHKLIKRDVKRAFEYAKKRGKIAKHRIEELPLFEGVRNSSK